MCALDLNKFMMENGKVASFAFPGGYPLYYLCADCGVLCPGCVNANLGLIQEASTSNDKQWLVVDAGINYQDDVLSCDNCNKLIPSAYRD